MKLLALLAIVALAYSHSTKKHEPDIPHKKSKSAEKKISKASDSSIPESLMQDLEVEKPKQRVIEDICSSQNEKNSSSESLCGFDNHFIEHIHSIEQDHLGTKHIDDHSHSDHKNESLQHGKTQPITSNKNHQHNEHLAHKQSGQSHFHHEHSNSKYSHHEQSHQVQPDPGYSNHEQSNHGHSNHEHSHQGHSHSEHSHNGHSHHGHSHHGHSHHGHSHSNENSMINTIFKPFISLLQNQIKYLGPMGSTVLSSIITSSASFFIFLFLWIVQKNETLSQDLLNTLTSFACGALLGDVFLHLIPSISFSNTSSLLILSGIMIFYIIDRVLSHEHSSHTSQETKLKTSPADSVNNIEKIKGKNRKQNDKISINERLVKDPTEKQEESALLLLLADFLHNVTDGMAIGASYAINPNLGISTTLAIFFHEIAHEIGDFIALLKFGVSLRSTLYINLLTGLGSLLGGVGSIYFGSLQGLKAFILPIIIGNFLYVSLVSMLCSMKSNPRKALKWEILFFVIGAYVMVLIEELE